MGSKCKYTSSETVVNEIYEGLDEIALTTGTVWAMQLLEAFLKLKRMITKEIL
jgi:hypothetical protein